MVAKGHIIQVFAPANGEVDLLNFVLALHLKRQREVSTFICNNLLVRS